MPVRNKSQNNPILWLIIVVLGGVALYAVFRKDPGENTVECGDGRTLVSNGVCSSIYGYKNVVIVAGNTQNSPKPNLSNDTVTEIIGDAFYATQKGSKPNIYVLSASDRNTINIRGLNGPAANLSASNERLTNNIANIENALATPPSKNGADYLSAILRAGELLHSKEDSAIIVIGSGISDSGNLLNFIDNKILNNYTGDNIKLLLESDSRLDKTILSGIDVYWQDIGETIAPQISLTDWKQPIRDIYSTTLSYFGAAKTDLYLSSSNKDITSVETDRTVKTVVPDGLILKPGGEISVNERVGEFYGDKATLKDDPSVKKWLKENVVIPYNNSPSQYRLELTGYLAIDVSSNTLAVQRAEKIKSILVELGIPSNLITTKGIGGPYNTRLKAAENRTVIIKVLN